MHFFCIIMLRLSKFCILFKLTPLYYKWQQNILVDKKVFKEVWATELLNFGCFCILAL